MQKDKLTETDEAIFKNIQENISNNIQKESLDLNDNIQSALDFYKKIEGEYTEDISYSVWVTFAETVLHELLSPIDLENKSEDYNPLYDIDIFEKEADNYFLKKAYQAYDLFNNDFYEFTEYFPKLLNYNDSKHCAKFFSGKKIYGDYNKRVIKPLCDLALIRADVFMPFFLFGHTYKEVRVNLYMRAKMPLYTKRKEIVPVSFTPFQYFEYALNNFDIVDFKAKNFLSYFFVTLHSNYPLYCFYSECATMEAFSYIKKYIEHDKDYQTNRMIVDVLKDIMHIKGREGNESYIQNMNEIFNIIGYQQEEMLDFRP